MAAAAEGGIGSFIQDHPTASIAGGLVLALVVGSYVLSHKSTPATSTNGPTANGDLSGLKNGNLVYVPTSTSFTTYNKNSNNSTSTSTSTSTTTVNPPPVVVSHPIPGPIPIGVIPHPIIPVPVRSQPPPQPKPVATAKSLRWDQRYTIRGGQNLGEIAASLTRSLRAAGMPGSQSVTWHDLYAHNTATINQEAAQRHNPIPGGPWNDVFPNETITTPRWG